MKRKLFILGLTLVLVVSLFTVVVPEAHAVTYTDAQWEELIQKQQANLFGGANVDWNDPQIQAIVEGRNSAGLTTSGFSYRVAATGWILSKIAPGPIAFLAVRTSPPR